MKLQAGFRTHVVVFTSQIPFPRLFAVVIDLLSTLTVAGAVLVFHQLPILTLSSDSAPKAVAHDKYP